MSVIQVCSSGYVIRQCHCSQDHGKPVVLKCTGSCPELYHRELNYRPELLSSR